MESLKEFNRGEKMAIKKNIFGTATDNALEMYNTFDGNSLDVSGKNNHLVPYGETNRLVTVQDKDGNMGAMSYTPKPGWAYMGGAWQSAFSPGFSSSFTLSFWALLGSVFGGYNSFVYRIPDVLQISCYAGSVMGFFVQFWSSDGYKYISITSPKHYQWAHYVIKYDGSFLYLYVDKKLYGKLEANGTLARNPSYGIRLLSNYDQDHAIWGAADEHRFYSTPLTDGGISVGGTATGEIGLLYDNGVNTRTSSTPVITPSTGTYSSYQTVSISAPVSDAIYYTINGTTPTPFSLLYTGSFEIRESTTIKAISIKTNYEDSDISTSIITINKLNPLSTTKNDSTTYYKTITIPIMSTDSGIEIRYTLNGSNPTNTSLIYTTPIEINSSTVIKAIATKSNYMNSPILILSYTISYTQAADPVILPMKESYLPGDTITISSTTPNSLIYYTLDGTDPTNSSTRILYMESFNIFNTVTIKAITTFDIYADSNITTLYIYIETLLKKNKVFDYCVFKKNPSLSENLNVNKLTYQIEFDNIIEV